MRRAPVLLLSLLSCACAPGSRTAYGPDDPLTLRTPPRDFYQSSLSSAAAEGKPPLFRAAVPAGYAVSDGLMGAPVAAIMTKAMPDGEVAVTVELYGEADGGLDPESFVRRLSPGTPPAPGRHVVDGKSFEVYHGIDFESFSRRIQVDDPHKASLGTITLPGLSPLGRRKFPVGGDAYRLYRCRKLGAWGMLGDYRRAQRRGEGKGFFDRLGTQDRRVLSACFGRTAVAAMEAGSPPPRVRKPAVRELRLMARDEWTHGASRRVERECVHIRPVPGGFFVLRLRAPLDDFADEHGFFEAFLSSFEPLPSSPAR